MDLAKTSTALTACAAAGFLIGAILSDNGSGLSSHNDGGTKVVHLDPAGTGGQSAFGIDKTTTASVRTIKDIDVEPLSEIQKTRELRLEKLRKAAQKNNSAGTQITKIVQQSIETTTNADFVLVKSGDTLYGISRKTKVGVKELAELNDLAHPYKIKVGQKLFISR